MYPRLKGRLHLYLLGLRFRWSYAVGLIGLLYSGITLMLDTPLGGALGLVIAVLFLLLGVVTVARDVFAVRKDTSDLYEVELSSEQLRALRLTDTYVSSGYQQVDLGELRAFYSPEVNRLLWAATPGLKTLERGFRLMRGAHALQPLLLRTFFGSGAVIFNQDKVRLVSDPTVESLRRGESVLVQKTDYFASLCTNEMARREVRSRETGAHRYSGLEAMASNGFLLDLEQSYCSNHVGVGSLAFTSNGQLVLTVQARGSAQNPNLLVPSASGSADWGDLREGDHLPGFLVRAMERELAEECGLEGMRPAPRVETRLLGFARLLMRGGKPEFFGVSYVDAPFADLSITRKESVYIADLLGSRVSRSRAEELTRSIDDFRRRHRHSMSIQLSLHLDFLDDFIRNCPDGLTHLMNGNSRVSWERRADARG